MKEGKVTFLKLIVITPVLMFIICCNKKKYTTADVESVKYFDKKYYGRIYELCSLLNKKLNKGNSYVMEYRPKPGDVYFSYRDSLGKGLGYFDPSFKINKDQEQLFIEAKAHTVYYDKKCDCFSMRLFIFKDGDKVIKLTIYNDITLIHSLDNVGYKIFVQNDRIYEWADAW